MYAKSIPQDGACSVCFVSFIVFSFTRNVKVLFVQTAHILRFFLGFFAFPCFAQSGRNIFMDFYIKRARFATCSKRCKYV